MDFFLSICLSVIEKSKFDSEISYCRDKKSFFLFFTQIKDELLIFVNIMSTTYIDLKWLLKKNVEDKDLIDTRTLNIKSVCLRQTSYALEDRLLY